jgi:hypothetical protein
MDSAGVKSVRLPSFDGTSDKFQIWWTRFMAYAGVHGFIQALKIGGESDMPDKEEMVLDATDDVDKKKIAAKKRNAIAMAHLTMALTTEGSMALVFEAMDENWPAGLAHKVVETMFQEYQPRDTMTRVELRTRLNKITMKRGDDPRVIFEQLSAVKNMYNTATSKIKEEDLIAVVIAAAPKDYQGVLTNEQLRLGGQLKLTDLHKAMNALWRSLGGSKSGGGDHDELALSAFDGYCFRCKKRGHKSHECPTKGQAGGGGSARKFNGKCNSCGKTGHMEKACWSKAENKDKRPQWLKDKDKIGEQANVNVGSKIEFVLCGVDREKKTFPNTQELLNDPNLWLGNSAATTHTTCHNIGMRNTKPATYKDAITVGNGERQGCNDW